MSIVVCGLEPNSFLYVFYSTYNLHTFIYLYLSIHPSIPISMTVGLSSFMFQSGQQPTNLEGTPTCLSSQDGSYTLSKAVGLLPFGLCLDSGQANLVGTHSEGQGVVLGLPWGPKLASTSFVWEEGTILE